MKVAQQPLRRRCGIFPRGFAVRVGRGVRVDDGGFSQSQGGEKILETVEEVVLQRESSRFQSTDV